MTKLLRTVALTGGEAIEARIVEMERKIDRLRALYESFFMGVERAPPHVPRRDLNRLMSEMQQMVISNATLRFRYQSLSQRWVLYTTYWNRTLREMESGTYRRDVLKAQKRMAEKGKILTETEAVAMGIPAQRAKAFVDRQQQMATWADARAKANGTPPSAPAVGVPPPPPATAFDVPGVSSAEVDDFYRRYVQAQSQISGVASAITIDQVKSQLRKAIPRIMEEKKCERVGLDVVIEGDKVKLRARPRRD